jgi:predicted metal-dependent hydrolase
MPKRDIEQFIASRENWINDRLKKSRERAEQREAFVLDYGSTVLYRGKEFPITAREGRRIGFDGKAFFMPPGFSEAELKAACVQIYKLLAKRDLNARTFELAKRIGVTPLSVRITSAKTRWGSCSARKSINYSWRLILADDDVIDYVVVHELAHLIEMNHSLQFWKIVDGITPGHEMYRSRLKELQKRITAEAWD